MAERVVIVMILKPIRAKARKYRWNARTASAVSSGDFS